MTKDDKPQAAFSTSEQRSLDAVTWKVGNEFAPFHPQASHVRPDYRDGWNACYRAAMSQPTATSTMCRVTQDLATGRKTVEWLSDQEAANVLASIGNNDKAPT